MIVGVAGKRTAKIILKIVASIVAAVTKSIVPYGSSQ